MDLQHLLNWRYATKRMDATKPVSDAALERILEAARLAPTSSGLQPFEILVIRNAGLRAKIQPIAKDQAQVSECSALLVFAAWDTYTAERINAAFDHTNAERQSNPPAWESYRQYLLASYPERDVEVNFQHAARQAYIALAFALIAAANEGVDSTPMEGFDNAALDQLLDLPARHVKSVALMPVGYRDSTSDWLVAQKKVRRPREQFAREVGLD